MLSSAKVLRGINGIRKEFRNQVPPVPDEMLTSGIVRMLAHYRENLKILPGMITVCRLRGCVFLTRGRVNLIQEVSTLSASGNWVELAFPFITAAINIVIGCVTITCSLGFHRYSSEWNRRIDETAKNEMILKKSLEQR